MESESCDPDRTCKPPLGIPEELEFNKNKTRSNFTSYVWMPHTVECQTKLPSHPDRKLVIVGQRGEFKITFFHVVCCPTPAIREWSSRMALGLKADYSSLFSAPRSKNWPTPDLGGSLTPTWWLGYAPLFTGWDSEFLEGAMCPVLSWWAFDLSEATNWWRGVKLG